MKIVQVMETVDKSCIILAGIAILAATVLHALCCDAKTAPAASADAAANCCRCSRVLPAGRILQMREAREPMCLHWHRLVCEPSRKLVFQA